MSPAIASMSSGTVLPDDIARFQEDGFAVLKGFIGADRIAWLRSAVRQALESSSGDAPIAAAQPQKTDARFHALSSAVRNSNLQRLTGGHCLVETGVWRRVKALADFALQGDLPEAASSLLGTDGVRFYGDELFVREPGAAGRAAFHRDSPQFDLDGDRGCVFWIPLDPVRRGGGARGYVPGAHRWNNEGADLPDIDSDPEAFNVIYAEADPGDVVVHHFLTAHGSETNSGTQIRRAFSLRYCDAALRYRRRPGSPSQPLPGVKDGDMLDDAFHPQVWPRRKVEAA